MIPEPGHDAAKHHEHAKGHHPHNRAPHAHEKPHPLQDFATSLSGIDFIFKHEYQEGKSEHLYYPEGESSGVTLGAGYDMRERHPEEIIKDMRAIGLDASVAKKISEASGLYGRHTEDKRPNAQDFVKENQNLVKLNIEQQKSLLRRALSEKEKIVKRHIFISQTQNQFDALVSFYYNPGKTKKTHLAVSHLLNLGKVSDAMAEIKTRTKSGGTVMNGLIRRRADEVNLYLYGMYLNSPKKGNNTM